MPVVSVVHVKSVTPIRGTQDVDLTCMWVLQLLSWITSAIIRTPLGSFGGTVGSMYPFMPAYNVKSVSFLRPNDNRITLNPEP